MLKYLVVIFVVLFSGACAISPPDSQHVSLNNANLWSYGVDPYGSKAIIGNRLIEDGAARIAFERAARPTPDRNTWIELIYHLPTANLDGSRAVRITYQCSEALLMKFSQRDFGEDGDNSYAHYQALLPAADDWQTITVNIADFSRPSWTPATSKDVGLKLENVSAIYLAPVLDDVVGGYARLNVRSIETLSATDQ